MCLNLLKYTSTRWRHRMEFTLKLWNNYKAIYLTGNSFFFILLKLYFFQYRFQNVLILMRNWIKFAWKFRSDLWCVFLVPKIIIVSFELNFLKSIGIPWYLLDWFCFNFACVFGLLDRRFIIRSMKSNLIGKNTQRSVFCHIFF